MKLAYSDQLVEDSRSALQGVRRALLELYDAIGADPLTPQVVSRSCKINRNLTWKLSRVMGAPEPFAALNHLPGERSIEAALSAFAKAGAPAVALENLRGALDTLNEVARQHAGDRAHLELTLESMGLLEREASIESGRELMYLGSSSVWGVQARTRLGANFVAPGIRPGTLDSVLLSGLVGIRRLRPTVEWRLYGAHHHDDTGSTLPGQISMEYIEEQRPGDPPMLVREFCSPNMPDLVAYDGPTGREIYLPRGQVGNQGAFDCFFGYIFRGLPSRRTESDKYGAFAETTVMPLETLVFDLIYHRDLPIPAQPEIQMFGFPHGGLEGPLSQSARNQLPLSEVVTELNGSPPVVATPLVPRITTLNERVFARMGWRPTDFRGLRLVLRHPPMNTRLVMRWLLPE